MSQSLVKLTEIGTSWGRGVTLCYTGNRCVNDVNPYARVVNLGTTSKLC